MILLNTITEGWVMNIWLGLISFLGIIIIRLIIYVWNERKKYLTEKSKEQCKFNKNVLQTIETYNKGINDTLKAIQEEISLLKTKVIEHDIDLKHLGKSKQ